MSTEVIDLTEKKVKIAVVIDGGVCQAVFADSEPIDIEVEVIDYDNLRTGEEDETVEAAEERLNDDYPIVIY